MDDVVYLEKSLHINRFKGFNLELEENEHILLDLLISIDGSILGVKREKVIPWFSDKEVREIRMGVKPMPKSFDIKSDDDFYKVMAILTSLDEGI